MSERLVVIGSQWGDEGKGKITDYFACKADMVVRYQGGNNAGHTVVFDGHKYSLQSIPSGIFNPKTVNVMANGMVINPVSVLAELDKLHAQGITDYQLYISDRAAVVMPYHSALDGAYEALKGGAQIGTTKKGIGPAYADKYSRVGIRMGDLLDKEYFAERLAAAVEIKNMELRMLGLETFEFEALYNEYMAIAEKIGHMICDTSALINEALESDKKVLFEGAQGMMLCIDHGTYPYVTSSTPSSASVPVGAGISPKWIDNVLGVAKAYCTRVGEGPFPTELFDNRAEEIRERGHEYGTVTGRPRRVGWFDAVVARYTAKLAGIDNWALMLFDVLSGLDKVCICTGYECDGKIINNPPATISQLAKCKPVLIELEGWKEDISDVK
ncbi:MAG: adenylosuccinate synthase, partial [Tidjanibacter sp.]|nr:adenylosuccinate synthase [Tidjanibacter sp.]